MARTIKKKKLRKIGSKNSKKISNGRASTTRTMISNKGDRRRSDNLGRTKTAKRATGRTKITRKGIVEEKTFDQSLSPNLNKQC